MGEKSGVEQSRRNGVEPESGFFANGVGIDDQEKSSFSAENGSATCPAGPWNPACAPKLLYLLRESLCIRNYRCRMEDSYCHWVKRFTYFHGVRHPTKMAESEINAFLTHLVIRGKVSASAQNQALGAGPTH